MVRPRDPEERRKIVAAMERQEKTRRAMRYTVVIIAGILVVAAGAYGFSKLPKPPQNVHWHATFDVYVNDERLSLAGAPNLIWESGQANFLPAHVHQCNLALIHNEGVEGRGSLEALFNDDWALQGGKLNDNELVIPPGPALAGDYKVNATHSLHLFVSENNGTWQPEPLNYALHDHLRYLLVYGNDTAAQVQQYEELMPPFEEKNVC